MIMIKVKKGIKTWYPLNKWIEQLTYVMEIFVDNSEIHCLTETYRRNRDLMWVKVP